MLPGSKKIFSQNVSKIFRAQLKHREVLPTRNGRAPFHSYSTTASEKSASPRQLPNASNTTANTSVSQKSPNDTLLPVNKKSFGLVASASKYLSWGGLEHWMKSARYHLPEIFSMEKVSSQVKSAASQMVKTRTETIIQPTKKSIEESTQQLIKTGTDTIVQPAKKSIDESAKHVTKTLQSVTSRSKSAASEFLEAGKGSVSRTMQAASAQAKSAASSWASAGQDAFSDSLRVASTRVQSTAKGLVDSGKEAMSQSAQSATAQVKSTASTLAQQGKETIVEEFRLIKRDVFWWLWWWSLAAIAIYGVATTLPGEIIREYGRRREKSSENNSQHASIGEDAVTEKEATKKASTMSSTVLSMLYPSWLSTTAQSETATDPTRSDPPDNDSLPQPSAFPEFGWRKYFGGEQKTDDNQTNTTNRWYSRLTWPTRRPKED